MMNWLVLAAQIILFAGYRSYIYIEKQATLEFARQYVKATYGDNFQIDEGAEHDFSRGTCIISANDSNRNILYILVLKKNSSGSFRVIESIEQ
ncbi:hypothetical protein ABD76_10305 [Paenibacillus dendritiformis]|nr:hypothetical protein [Paenibacillus dendritiformis]